MMKTIYHAAGTRGQADHGWLKSNHTFSFANYQNRARMHFGVVRVMNDDHVEGGEARKNMMLCTQCNVLRLVIPKVPTPNPI